MTIARTLSLYIHLVRALSRILVRLILCGLATIEASAQTTPAKPVFIQQPLDFRARETWYMSQQVMITNPGNTDVTWKAVFARRTLDASPYSQIDKFPGSYVGTLVFGPITLEDAGSFQIIATNAAGPTVSTSCFISVDPAPLSPPIIFTQPKSQDVTVGDRVLFNVQATGSELRFEWRKEGVPIAEATDAYYEIPEVKASDAGNYTVGVSNRLNVILSAVAVLKVGSASAPVITTQPQSMTATLGFATKLTVAAIGSSPVTYQWRKNGQPIEGANSPILDFSSPVASDAGDYTVVLTNRIGSSTSAVAKVTVIGPTAPVITVQPSDQTALAGSPVTIFVTAVGSEPMTYTWTRDGFSDPVGAQGNRVQLGANEAYAGTYVVTISNPAGSVTSRPALLKVVTQTTPPTITSQSSDLTIKPGDAAALRVSVRADPPTTYQWYRDSIAINGATSDTLNFASAKVTDSGSYTCTITAFGGSITSRAIILSVLLEPPSASIAGPTTLTKSVGEPLALSSTVGGTGPLSLQWYRDNTALAGATSGSLALANLSVGDSGAYTIKVTNVAGTVTSKAVQVSVLTQNPARLINLSLLTALAVNEDFRLGFVTGGNGTSGTKPLLIRAVGPTLGGFGVGGPHSDPKLELFRDSTQIAVNDNWADDPGSRTGAIFTAVGAFDFASATSKDASLAASTLAAGGYTVHVLGAPGTSGAVLAELYETTSADKVDSTTPRLVNVSVLKKLGTGFTVGFVVGGNGTKRILARAVGPGLAAFGLTDAAADPSLVLKNSAGTAVASNDNWLAADAAAMTATGAFNLAAGSQDAALVVTLQPGSYTLQVSATGTNAANSVLVEVYEVP